MNNSDINALFDLSGKVAIVTGAGDGIGKGCAKILALAGASVVVSDLSIDKANAVAKEIKEAGGTAAAVSCNVLDFEDLKRLLTLLSILMVALIYWSTTPE